MTPPIRNSRLQTSQGKLFWREVGYGPTVLMLHSSWQDSRQWVPLMELLGSDFHCLAPDLLGFGESDRLPLKAYSISQEVSCLQEYLAQLRTTPEIIVADSLGAWVALQYCLQYPNIGVRKLVLLAPDGLYHRQIAQQWRQLKWLAGPWAVRYRLIQSLALLLRQIKGDRWLQKLKQRRRQLRRNLAACRLLFQRQKSALQADYVNASLPQLQLPVLILQPEAASALTTLRNQVAVESISSARVETLRGNEVTLWTQLTSEGQTLIREFLLDQALL